MSDIINLDCGSKHDRTSRLKLGDRPIGAVRRTGAIACGRIKGPLSSDV
jgi:hypothetical protein